MYPETQKLRVALVHDYLNQSGGAEVVLRWIHHIFPDAPIYTLIYDPELVPPDFRNWDIRPVGWSRYLPFKRKLYKYYLLIYPSMIEQINLDDYDLVISSSYLWAKGVLTRSETLHICYCHTPMRQAWELYFQYKESYSKFISKFIYPFAFNYLRIWDRVSADRVDKFIANSATVQKRIAKFYRRDSVVIHPPVEIGNIKPSFEEGDYYICISRLVPYKKIDLAVRAFNELGRRLVVVGTGPQLGYLKRIARENIRFEGFVSEERKIELLRHARALIFPGEEDFGITPVEAQAAGRPVIAYGRGGVTETVIDGLTGVFFYEQTEKALIDAVVKFEQMSFDPQLAVNNARHFGVQHFVSRMRQFITDSVAEFFGEEYVPKLISAMNPGVVSHI